MALVRRNVNAEQRPRKVLVHSLNALLQCKLCYGYLIEPTTLIDCFHTFCYSCIVRFILVNDEKFLCPICGSRFTSDNPLQSLCHDEQLQSIIFKLIPNLFKNEKQKRLEFYKSKNLSYPSRLFHFNLANEFFAQFDHLSLSLRPYDNNVAPQRYLRCSMFTRIAHLMKLLKLKFLEMGMCNVQIIYLNYIIPSYYRLIDFIYVFQNEFDIRNEPIEIFYQFIEPVRKKRSPVPVFRDLSPSSSSFSSPSTMSSYSSSDDYVYKSKKRNKRRKKSTKTFHAQAFCSSDLKLRLKLTQKPFHRKKRRKHTKEQAVQKRSAINGSETAVSSIWQKEQRVIETAQFCTNQAIMTAVQSQIVRMIPNPSLLVKQQREAANTNK